MSTAAQTLILKPVPKTTEGLRDALFDELNALRAGKSNPQQARAVAQMADKIIDSIRVQIQYGRLLHESGKPAKQIHLGAGKP